MLDELFPANISLVGLYARREKRKVRFYEFSTVSSSSFPHRFLYRRNTSGKCNQLLDPMLGRGVSLKIVFSKTLVCFISLAGKICPKLPVAYREKKYDCFQEIYIVQAHELPQIHPPSYLLRKGGSIADTYIKGNFFREFSHKSRESPRSSNTLDLGPMWLARN